MWANGPEAVVDEKLRLWHRFILGRSIVTAVLALLLVLLLGPRPQATQLPLYLLVGLQLAVNLIYLYLWRRRDISFLGYLAFSLESVLITLLIYFLGADGHAFALAYLWPIIMGGWLIGKGAIAPLTLLSGIGYGTLILLERLGLVLKQRLVTAEGISLPSILSLPYLAFIALVVWLLTSEMERGEAELQHERNVLRGILANMGEAVFVVDPGRRVLLANRAAEHLLDIRQGAALPPWFLEQIAADRDPDTPPGAQQLVEFRERIVSISATELSGPSVPASTLYVGRDITQQAQLDQLKSDFVAFVSHELRTPLTTIKTLVRLLLMDTPAETKAHEYLTVINAQVERQRHLVSNLLDFTRLEAGKYELPPENVDPRQVIAAALGVCGPLAEEKGLKLEVSCGEPPSDGFISNREGLEQVLINLLSNAIKFTDAPGQVRVSYHVEGAEICFVVEDTGIGMTQEELGRIFQKFYTVRTPGRHGRGTGLGLVISAMIVKKLGGRIEVASQVGVGSRFTVRLPLRMPEASPV